MAAEPLRDELAEMRLKRLEAKIQALADAVMELVRELLAEDPVEQCVQVA